MPEETVKQKAEEDKREGKSPSTQAGEFVREEIHHVREGKHGARSPQQAIAIGLSKARRAGVKLPPPKGRGRTTRQAKRDLAKGRSGRPRASGKRSRAVSGALRSERHSSASRSALSRQGHRAAVGRSSASRHNAAMKAVRTKGRSGLQRAARKAARTRQRHRAAA